MIGSGIRAYRSAEKNGEWLTMSEAAAQLGVTNHRIRLLIKDRVLPAEQDATARARNADNVSAGAPSHRISPAVANVGSSSDPGRPPGVIICRMMSSP
jgi:excisionase family DNA binding protein